MAAAMPANETGRLAALRAYRVLDTAPEQSFDELARVAGFLCHAPIVAVSLVDHQRLWFKAKVGFDAAEAPRERAFCAHAILDVRPLLVPDACNDPRFAENTLVTGAPGFRFYAGAPLIAPGGFALGTLCVLDLEPRPGLSRGQIDGLTVLARQIVTQLELRRMARHALDAVSASAAHDGDVTVCAWCKTVNEGGEQWRSFEEFIKSRLDIRVSHGMCPHCFIEHSQAIERPQ